MDKEYFLFVYIDRWTCRWHTHLYMWVTSWNDFSDKLWTEHDRIILQHITKSCSDCPSITIKWQHKRSLCASLTVSWHCHLIKQIAWWGIHSYTHTAAELNDWSMITVHKIRSMAPVVYSYLYEHWLYQNLTLFPYSGIDTKLTVYLIRHQHRLTWWSYGLKCLQVHHSSPYEALRI